MPILRTRKQVSHWQWPLVIAAIEKSLKSLADDPKTPEETRIAAVEGLGSFPDSSAELLERLVESVRGKASSNSIADAALRTISGTKNEGKRLVEVLTAPEYPLGLRREALRTLAHRQGGGEQILNLAGSGKTSRRPQERCDYAGSHGFQPTNSRSGSEDFAPAQNGRRGDVATLGRADPPGG